MPADVMGATEGAIRVCHPCVRSRVFTSGVCLLLVGTCAMQIRAHDVSFTSSFACIYAHANVPNRPLLHLHKSVFSADNGGPIYRWGDPGANNFPLKGGKASNWEGGIRVNAFVAGGALPVRMQGTVASGLIALWDWWVVYGRACGWGCFGLPRTSSLYSGLLVLEASSPHSGLLVLEVSSPYSGLLMLEVSSPYSGMFMLEVFGSL
jgi:hypothetical protein